MPLIADYLARQFAPFSALPFNAVDSAALTQLCMVRGRGVIPLLPQNGTPRETGGRLFGVRRALGRIIPARGGVRGNVRDSVRGVGGGAAGRQGGVYFRDLLLAEHFADMFTGLDPAKVKDNLFALAASPRFRTMTVQDYLSLFDEERETQFAAMTFVWRGDGAGDANGGAAGGGTPSAPSGERTPFAYIGFRGTDATLTGWKEDFNMAYAMPVPAQEQALRYLEAVAPHLPARLLVGGHSKGGNLTEYAALKASPAVQQRIERVFIHDGPGFKEGAFSDADYAPLAGKLHKTVPQNSIVGITMESQAPLSVVRSAAHGIDQHSVFTWELADDLTDFAYLDELPEATKLMASSLREWLARLDDAEKEQVVEALFRTIEASGTEDALDALAGGGRSLNLLVEAARNINDNDRDVLLSAGRNFIQAAAKQALDKLSGGEN